ncbi:hypothetical protein KFL_000780180 [Klebsormidium nitens]|uniref:Uncharacterized protein n=1 Tax=Klebsormidium nitens TaxID=105231 RepID=A0A1Y1HXV8_KLENI|nr:hypothetical protein KFL_000780180 [Klebsormidium nitens]|eukprot:GAQ81356.1 hypothetical protein KFL_000780180 [Klebsormidium nitens]
MSIAAQGIRSLGFSRRRSGDDASNTSEEHGRAFRHGADSRAIQSSLDFRSRSETPCHSQISPDIRSVSPSPGKVRREAFTNVATELASPEAAVPSFFGQREGERALRSSQQIVPRRSYSNASSATAAAKPNDAKFWFTKAKAVYSCRPFSPKKKQGAPLKPKGPARRSASFASVWPITGIGDGVPHRQNVNLTNYSDDTVEDTVCKYETATVGGSSAVGSEGRPDDESSGQLDSAGCSFEQLASDTSAANAAANQSRYTACRSGIAAEHPHRYEPAESHVYTRIESGRIASTSSPSPPPRSPARYLPRRSKSVTDADIRPPFYPQPGIKDGESLLETLPQGGLYESTLEPPHDGSASRLRHAKSLTVVTLLGGDSDDEQRGRRQGRRRTWSSLQLGQSLRGDLEASPPSSPLGRSRSKTGKRSFTSKFGSSRHRKRSYLAGSDPSFRGVSEEHSRTSLDGTIAFETQLNAERSVRAWAAENRPPRKGMDLAIKAAADANAHLSTNYEKAKNKARQLQAQLERLTEISANLDRSLSAYEELTRGDQEVLQKLEDANDVTEGERMTTKRYEHMLTRVQEELSRLKGSVDTITKEVKAAERARAAVTQRQETGPTNPQTAEKAAVTQRQEGARAESVGAREALVRAKRELGGLHFAWHAQLDELKRENEENEEAVQYSVRRERMRQRILRELGKNGKPASSSQPGDVSGRALLPDGAPSDVKLASYEALTGLVGTRDVPSIISMYAERKENNEKLLEAKGRGEERLRRLKDERAELEVALKQVVYVDLGQAVGAQAGFKTEIQKKEDRLRRDQERTLAAERDISLVGTCLWQLLARIPDSSDALQGLPAAYFKDAAAAATPNPQTPAVAPRHAPRKSVAKGSLDAKHARMPRSPGGRENGRTAGGPRMRP